MVSCVSLYPLTVYPIYPTHMHTYTHTHTHTHPTIPRPSPAELLCHPFIADLQNDRKKVRSAVILSLKKEFEFSVYYYTSQTLQKSYHISLLEFLIRSLPQSPTFISAQKNGVNFSFLPSPFKQLHRCHDLNFDLPTTTHGPLPQPHTVASEDDHFADRWVWLHNFQHSM